MGPSGQSMLPYITSHSNGRGPADLRGTSNNLAECPCGRSSSACSSLGCCTTDKDHILTAARSQRRAPQPPHIACCVLAGALSNTTTSIMSSHNCVCLVCACARCE
jgi:hypothetical protein